VKIVFCWYFGYAVSSSLTLFAYTHERRFRGGGGRRVPLYNWNGVVNETVFPKFVVFLSTLSRLFCVCGSCCGNLQPLPNPLSGFKCAARWGREGNVDRGGGKTEERKENRGIGKGEEALAPRKKNRDGTQ